MIIRIAIRRVVTISMIVLAVLLFGIVSLDRLPLSLLPEISYPSVTVQTNFPDAAPEEVETLVTRPVEEVVGTLPGLSRLSSISRPGQSEVLLEFAWDKDMGQTTMEVREKLDLLEPPRDAERSVILRFDPSNDPIIRMHLFGDVGLARLRHISERELKKGLESLEGVAAVRVAGGHEEQIHIEVDEKRLAELGIPITEVAQVIERGNLNRASGSLYDQEANYLVRLLNEFRSVEEIRRLAVRDQDGRKIVLGDIAHVWRGSRDRDVIARFNGEESVELAVYKEGDANAVSVSTDLRKKMKTLTTGKIFPRGVSYSIVFDQAEFIQQAVRNVLTAAVLGGFLATAVLFLFLRDFRSTVIISLVIPISVMATFTLMHQTGVTLNIMSLGGIALGVGMLIDNAIVVLESVHRHRRRKEDLEESVFRGTKEVGMAITASTLTTVAVFLPLVFVEGVAGQLFRDQALTITYSVLASLLVALTVVPMILALQVKSGTELETDSSGQVMSDTSGPRITEKRFSGFIQTLSHICTAVGRILIRDVLKILVTDLRRLLRFLSRQIQWLLNPALEAFGTSVESANTKYVSLLAWCLRNRLLVVGSVAGLLSLSVIAYHHLGAELIPSLAQGEFSFEIKLPEGRPLEHTDSIISAVEEAVREYPEVADVFSTVGGSTRNQFSNTVLEENFGQLHVVVKKDLDRIAEAVVIDRIRTQLSAYPEVTYVFSRPTLFSLKTPIEVEIYSYDLDAQRDSARLVVEQLEKIPGLGDIQTTTKPGSPEIQVRLRHDVPARLGLDESQIIEVINNKIRGTVASLYRDSEKQIEILVRADEKNRDRVEDIRNLVVNDWEGGNRESSGMQRFDSESQDQDYPGIGRTARQGENDVLRGASNPITGTSTSVNGRPGIPVTLAAIADIRMSRGPSEINRIQSQRVAVVSANLIGRDLKTVSSDINAALVSLGQKVPPETSLVLAGQNEELERSYKSLLFAMALAVFLVYLVMASQFESFIHPLIILFTVPVSIVGVVFALLLTGTTVSVIVLLGVIILIGIVVNNAIVLVDYTNQLRRNGGLAKHEALLEAGRVRMRPILMTTTTTVLGLLPMSLGWGDGSEVRAPMAIAVMGGLLFSTLLTLILIPVVYDLVDRKVIVPADAGRCSQPSPKGLRGMVSNSTGILQSMDGEVDG